MALLNRGAANRSCRAGRRAQPGRAVACAKLVVSASLRVGVAGAVASPAGAESGAINRELQVKAACLSSFSKFVEWPVEPGAGWPGPT